MRHSVALAAVVLATATPGGSTAALSAQAPGTVEVGGFGQVTWFDEGTTLTQYASWGGGGLLGVFVAPNLALEGAWSRTWTEDASPAGVDGHWDAWRARLIYGLPFWQSVQPLVGAGYIHNAYYDAVTDYDDGITGLLGLKVYVSDRVALRGDAQLDVQWAPFNDGSTVRSKTVFDHLNWTLGAGLSVDLGGGRARDSDRDGVRDRLDACPDTPLGVSIDASGCRVDTDRDGVFDEDDTCAATPGGARVDASGCQVDTDGDGVFDEYDGCADTGGDVQVDGRGCRLDTDRDGVFDEDDACALTEPGVAVDARGCPQLFAPEATVVVLEGVTFEFGSDILTGGARRVLDRVAQSLLGSPDVRVRVSGHTDSTGARAYNVELSQRRAESVVRHFLGRGVPTGRLEAVGYGPDLPVADNGTSAGRAMNRRVELERIN
jgi:OOP family OmpA-OmpF porin